MLEQRTNYDIEMMREMGFTSGIENYSRHMDGRKPGEPPYTLLDFFPKDFYIMVDESHVTMATDYAGCTMATVHGRKCWSTTASACQVHLDNRPLRR